MTTQPSATAAEPAKELAKGSLDPKHGLSVPAAVLKTMKQTKSH